MGFQGYEKWLKINDLNLLQSLNLVNNDAAHCWDSSKSLMFSQVIKYLIYNKKFYIHKNNKVMSLKKLQNWKEMSQNGGGAQLVKKYI